MTESPLLYGLPPLIDGRSRTLVLGSFPSVKSLESGRYYGNPLNQFWRLVELSTKDRAFGNQDGLPPFDDYNARCEWLLAHSLAIWDTIGACQRKGSLDKSIKHIQVNPIVTLLIEWPEINHIVLNGGLSAQQFDQLIAPSLPKIGRGLHIFRVPSSSPIPTKNFRKMEDKLPLWREALQPSNQ